MTVSVRDVEQIVRQMIDGDQKRPGDVLMELARIASLATGNDQATPQGWITPLMRESQPETRALMAAALARVIAADRLPNSVDQRQAALKLLGEEFRAALDLRPDLQGFELEQSIGSALRSSEADFANLLPAVVSLDALQGIRQRLMKLLNHRRDRVLVRPFLPEALLGPRLDELFSLVTTYSGTIGSSKVPARLRVETALQRFEHDALQYGTQYASDYLAALSLLVQRAIAIDFAQSEYSKPAVLEVGLATKKYAFSAGDRPIDIIVPIDNVGAGAADRVELVVTATSHNIAVERQHTYVGQIGAAGVEVSIPAKTVAPYDGAVVDGTIQWRNYDDTVGKTSFELVLSTQRSDIPWDDLLAEDPYSLQPVSGSDELVGRREVLSRLLAATRKVDVGSVFLYGQKRVGKTSVAQALGVRLKEEFPEDYLVVYIESGDYIDADAEGTVRNLGRRLCEEVRDADPRLAGIPIPAFARALTPIADYLRAALAIVPTLRILMILDEFDEMPLDLYKRGELGDAFFLTLRTISGKRPFGFVLVGGEKMDLILSAQGDHLNRFAAVRLDYFDKKTHWNDFVDLVQRPVTPWLEFTEPAIDRLYSITAGSPYFTKLVCRELLETVVRDRDAHITEREVEAARQQTIRTIASNSFQHFWEDGILEPSEKVEQISIDRRKVMLAYAEAVRAGLGATDNRIVTNALRANVSTEATGTLLRDFVRRRILVQTDGMYRCNVDLFGDWLVEKGMEEILTTFMDSGAVGRLRDRDETDYVTSEELVDVVGRWPTFKGVPITDDRVRAWLNQFVHPRERRLMFKMLAGLRFFGSAEIREKLQEGHSIVRRGLKYEREHGQRRVREVLVSFVDGPGKSGAAYARLYAEENGIFHERVVAKDALGRQVELNQEVQAVVFVDDFLGTGESAGDYFEALAARRSEIWQRPTKNYFIAVAGFSTAQERLQQRLRDLGLDVEVRVCEPLGESSRLFSDSSSTFPDEDERRDAEVVARRYGGSLVRNNPLGWRGMGAGVLFDQSIPNNAPPVLWAQAPDWRPLFPDH